jgi:hypothetical protein
MRKIVSQIETNIQIAVPKRSKLKELAIRFQEADMLKPSN